MLILISLTIMDELIFSLSSVVCHFPSQHEQKTVAVERKGEVPLLILASVVSGINLLLPGIFNLASRMESYNSPSVRVYVSIFR